MSTAPPLDEQQVVCDVPNLKDIQFAGRFASDNRELAAPFLLRWNGSALLFRRKLIIRIWARLYHT